MIGKTTLLATIPVGVALLAGAALPPGAAGQAAHHAAGDPLWHALLAAVLVGIVGTAGLLLVRAVGPRGTPARQPRSAPARQS